MSVTTSETVRRALASAAAAGEAGAGAGAGGQGGEQLAQQDQEGAEGAAGEGAARTLRELSFNNFALTFKLCVRVAISWYQGCKKLQRYATRSR